MFQGRWNKNIVMVHNIIVRYVFIWKDLGLILYKWGYIQ